MADNLDFSKESPETDSSIIKSTYNGMWDNEVAFSEKLAECTTAWTGWYNHPRGGVYKICKDGDGYLVYKPGGGVDAWGTGYTWRDVKSGYGLAGITAYQSRCNASCR
jgi:hypothetical protein